MRNSIHFVIRKAESYGRFNNEREFQSLLRLFPQFAEDLKQAFRQGKLSKR
jgi:hypothetical protein